MNGYMVVIRAVYDADGHRIATVMPSPEAPGLLEVTFSDYAASKGTPAQVTLPASCVAPLVSALTAAAQESLQTL